MARVNVPLTTIGPNARTANPAGTAADETDGHTVSGAPLEEIVLRVTLASAGDAATVTVLAGDSPPALEAGLGNLAASCPDDAISFIGPFTSGRFAQADGSLEFDIDDETGVTIAALRIPRTA